MFVFLKEMSQSTNQPGRSGAALEENFIFLQMPGSDEIMTVFFFLGRINPQAPNPSPTLGLFLRTVQYYIVTARRVSDSNPWFFIMTILWS